MNIHSIYIRKVKEELEVLQDKEKQIRVWTWTTRADEYPSSYVETMCSLFDDSGFNMAIEGGETAGFLGAELTNLLVQIGSLVDRIDYSKDPVDIANLPEMEEIRQLAQQALNDPIFHIDAITTTRP